MKVFFNASVILSGLRSPAGGSGKLLRWVKQNKIQGLINETILDEVIRRSYKVKISPIAANKATQSIFSKIFSPPTLKQIKFYSKSITDEDDAHVLASAKAAKCQYLVSLDKKHILSLKSKKFPFKIVSPGEIIKTLSSN